MDEIQNRRLVSRSLVTPRLAALQNAGLDVASLQGDEYLIAERIVFHASTGHWRTLDYSRHGYTIVGLIREIKDFADRQQRLDKPNPVAGRDSVIAAVDPDRTAELTTDTASAESVAGADKKMPGGWP